MGRSPTSSRRRSFAEGACGLVVGWCLRRSGEAEPGRAGSSAERVGPRDACERSGPQGARITGCPRSRRAGVAPLGSSGRRGHRSGWRGPGPGHRRAADAGVGTGPGGAPGQRRRPEATQRDDGGDEEPRQGDVEVVGRPRDAGDHVEGDRVGGCRGAGDQADDGGRGARMRHRPVSPARSCCAVPALRRLRTGLRWARATRPAGGTAGGCLEAEPLEFGVGPAGALGGGVGGGVGPFGVDDGLPGAGQVGAGAREGPDGGHAVVEECTGGGLDAVGSGCGRHPANGSGGGQQELRVAHGGVLGPRSGRRSRASYAFACSNRRGCWTQPRRPAMLGRVPTSGGVAALGVEDRRGPRR